MKTITPPQIPNEFQNFASQVAALAIQNGIDKFKMTFVPTFEKRIAADRRVRGEMTIHFSSVDHRGRPARSLGIHLNADLILTIESEPASE